MVAGKYRIEAAIGRGGMGAVYRATHIQLLQPVALKVLLPGVVNDLPDAVQRFLREARASARITSEHVAKVIDVDAEGETPYMAMEYLEGTDLSKQLKQRTRFSISESLAYTLDVCAALSEAHALGIVHRDLKPQNMFLTRRADGRAIVKVLDFGISKVSPVGAVEGEGTDLTGTQTVLGSPRYMSPEQMRATKHVDLRTDIWALGVCLYEFLTGTVPFEAPTQFELGAHVLTMNPDPPSSRNRDVPPQLDYIVLRCLAKDPAQRFPSIAELVAALAPLTAAAPTSTNHSSPSGPMQAQQPISGTVAIPPALGPFLGATPARPSSPFFSNEYAPPGMSAQGPVPPGSQPGSGPLLFGFPPSSQPPGAQTNATWSDNTSDGKLLGNRRAVILGVAGVALGVLVIIGRVVSTSSPAPPTSGYAGTTTSAPAPVPSASTTVGAPTTAPIATNTAVATTEPAAVPPAVPTPSATVLSPPPPSLSAKPAVTVKKPTSPTAPTARPALPNER